VSFLEAAEGNLKLRATCKRKKKEDKHSSLKQYQLNVLKVNPNLSVDEEIGKLCNECCEVSIDPGQGLEEDKHSEHATTCLTVEELASLADAEK